MLGHRLHVFHSEHRFLILTRSIRSALGDKLSISEDNITGVHAPTTLV